MLEHPMSAGKRTAAEPTVSVVIPSYGCAAYLREAIESTRVQTHRPLEIIVVDDGSTDGSLEIAREYGDPVRVVTQPNSGVSVARNRGINEARGEWIAFLDADDAWEPTKLERQMAAIVTGADADGVCAYTDFDRVGGPEDGTVEQRPDHPSAPDFRVRMLCEYTVLPSTAVVRASALDGLRFPVGITDSEDMIFLLELRERGQFLHVPEALVAYRILPTSAVRRAGHELRSVRARYDYAKRHPDRYSEADRLAIRRQLALALLRGHDRALWRDRDPRMVRAYRKLFDEVRPPDLPVPPSFRRRLFPRWMYQLRDALASITER